MYLLPAASRVPQSIGTYLLAWTPLSAEEVKAILVRAPELADLGLAD